MARLALHRRLRGPRSSSAIRVTLRWRPGEASLDRLERLYVDRVTTARDERQPRRALDLRRARAPRPRRPRSATRTARYVVDALRRAPSLRDVVIWNEANSPRFWRPAGQAAAAAYVALLARCYDVVHETLPAALREPDQLDRAAPRPALVHRAARRRLPRERPDDAHLRHVRAQPVPGHERRGAVRRAPGLAHARPGRLRRADGRARPPRSAARASRSRATKGVSALVPRGRLRDGGAGRADRPATRAARSRGRRSQPVRGVRRRRARPGVAAARRARARLLPARRWARSSTSSSSTRRGLGGWQSGLLWADGARKPSYAPFKQAVADVGDRQGRLLALPGLGARRRVGGAGPSSSILAGVLRAVVFDVDFTLARPGPDLGPDGLPAARPPLRARPRPGALRPGARRRLRRGEAPPRARPRRGDLGALHRADHRGHGRHRRHVRRRGRDGAALVAVGALRALRRRAAGARRAARPRPQDRPALELVARPRRVRRAPRARRRRRAHLARARQDEAAPRRSSAPCSSGSRSSRPRR